MVSLLVITDSTAQTPMTSDYPLFRALLEKKNSVNRVFVADKSDAENDPFFTQPYNKNTPPRRLAVRVMDNDTAPFNNGRDANLTLLEPGAADAAWLRLDPSSIDADFFTHAGTMLTGTPLLEDPDAQRNLNAKTILPFLVKDMSDATDHSFCLSEAARAPMTGTKKHLPDYYMLIAQNDILCAVKKEKRNSSVAPAKPGQKEQKIVEILQTVMQERGILFCAAATQPGPNGTRCLSYVNAVNVGGFFAMENLYRGALLRNPVTSRAADAIVRHLQTKLRPQPAVKPGWGVRPD